MLEFDPRAIEREDGRVFLHVRHLAEWAEEHSPLIVKALPDSEYVQLAMLGSRLYAEVHAMYSVGADKSDKAAGQADEGAAAAIAANPKLYSGFHPLQISEDPRYVVATQRARECIQEIKDAIQVGANAAYDNAVRRIAPPAEVAVPYTEPEAAPPARQPGKPKRETQGDLVEKWLAECEKRAKELKPPEPFDRWNMPGLKLQFLDLLRRQEPSFRKVELSTLDRHYLPRRCRWSEGANANPDATPLYERLFPDAYPKRRAVSA